MKATKTAHRTQKPPIEAGRRHSWPGRTRWGGFTLVEMLVTIVLVSMLIIAGISSLMMMERSSARLADYTAAAALVRGRLEAIIAATYAPPASPFTSSTVRGTNAAAIALQKASTNYLVNGFIVSVIQPVAAGHLVTVTGTFPLPGKPLVVTEQTLVNRFSGGQN